MKNTFLITTLLATTALATNAVAACTPVNNGDCGTNCTYTIDTNCHLIVQGPTTEGLEGSIMTNAFYNNSNIKSAEIKGNITSIGQNAFYYASLTSVTIPASVTTIGQNAFAQAKSLTSVVIPDSVTDIGRGAFSGATSLTSVTIPDSVTSIGYSAFYGASSLTSVVIPDSVTYIVQDAFNGIPSTAEIFCPNQACKDKVTAAGYTGSNFVDYTKGTDGVYSVGDTMFASAEDMRARQNACTSEAQCREKVQEYKEAKATQMAQNGVLCQTKQGCLNLMDLVSSSTSCKAGEANSYANCSAAVKNGTITGVNLAAADPVGGGTGGADSSTNSGKRIYTVEEARQAVDAAGTDTVNVRIRYK